MELTKREKEIIAEAEKPTWAEAHAHLSPEERGMAMVAQGHCS